MQHNPGFLKFVDAARARVKECTVAEAKARLDRGEALYFLDVRETSSLRRIMRRAPGILEKELSSAMWKRSFPINRRPLCCIAEVAIGRS